MSDHLNLNLGGKVAVVTGGAKGIGAACVRVLAGHGARVACLDLDEGAAAALADSVENVVNYGVDVSNSGQVSAAFTEIVGDLGPPTLLVNNAGIVIYGTAADTSEDDWDRVLDVNLKAQFLCAREAIPHMQAGGGGAIVNVASVQSFICQQTVASYAASKAGVLGLTRSIAVDFAPSIRCNAVCPGSVDTPMLANAVAQAPNPEAVLQECRDMHLTGRIAEPQEVADLVAYLLSDRAGFITGQSVRVDGGLGLMIGGN